MISLLCKTDHRIVVVKVSLKEGGIKYKRARESERESELALPSNGKKLSEQSLAGEHSMRDK